MIEDKLSHDERLRLECIAQSVALVAMKQVSSEAVVDVAKTFEKYVSDATKR